MSDVPSALHKFEAGRLVGVGLRAFEALRYTGRPDGNDRTR